MGCYIKSHRGVIASDRKRTGTVIAQTEDDIVISDGVITRHQFVMPKSKVDYYDGSDVYLKYRLSYLVFLKPAYQIAILPTSLGRLLLQLLSNSQSILVVDDELDIVESIKLWLQKRGLEVQGFTDPILALEYFKNNSGSIGLVLSDIRMPQMNGCELVKRIKNLRTEVKIILMSAFEINHAEMKKVLPDIKIDSLISKPISLGNLTKTIEMNLK